MSSIMPTVSFSDGTVLPALGLGTYQIGRDGASVADGINALRHGIDLGLALIDTAELYGDGDAEEIVGQAVKGIRDKTFIVSKVHPQNASRGGTIEACERSLKRLNTEQIDLYLLHWQSEFPLNDTIEAFEKLRENGKIARWGLSNLDLPVVEKLRTLPLGRNVMANQVLYNLNHRGPEFDFIPWSAENNIPLMAYSPFEEGRLLRNAELQEIALRRSATPAQVALAFILAKKNVIAIPKSSSVDRVSENFQSMQVVLSKEDMAALDNSFPPPKGKVKLELGW